MHIYSLIGCLPLILVVSILIISSLCYFLLPQMSLKQSVIEIDVYAYVYISIYIYIYIYICMYIH